MALDAQGPFNYNTNFTAQPVSPMQSFTSGIGAAQTATGNALQLQAAAVQNTQAVQMQRDLTAAAQNPTPDAIAALSMKYPQMADKFKQSFDMMTQQQRDAKLNQAVPIYAAIQAGKVDTAVKLLTSQADAYDNAGRPQDAAQARAMAKLVQLDPHGAKLSFGFGLAAGMGSDKFVDTFGKVGAERRAEETQPAAVTEANAKAKTAAADAAVAPTMADLKTKDIASQIADRSTKLGLQADEIKSKMQIQLREIDEKYGAPQGANLEFVNKAAEKAATADSMANRFSEYADKADQLSKGYGGQVGRVAESLKQVLGSQDAISALKSEYQALRSQLIAANLPPQVTRLTDADLKVFAAGIPDANADPRAIATFLRAGALIKHIEASTEDAKAQWAAANRGMQNARKEFDLNGITVGKGTTFRQYLGDYLAQDIVDYKQEHLNKEVKQNSSYAPFLTPKQ